MCPERHAKPEQSPAFVQRLHRQEACPTWPLELSLTHRSGSEANLREAFSADVGFLSLIPDNLKLISYMQVGHHFTSVVPET